MRRSFLIPLLLGALAAWCGSCIENNLPYPVVELAVLSCEGEGFTAEIDAKTRTVVLRLDETTDISRVRITDMRITAEARASAPLTGEFDLRTPQFITLSLYQDYEWELRAEQRIERRFAVEGQIGAAEIDSERRTATAHVGMDADLRAVRITDLKLGPEGITTLNPAPEELTDFSSVRYVYVTYHDFEERWALYVRQTELVVALSAADLWRNTGTLSIASQPGAETVALEYRRSGTEEWRAADVTLAEDGTCSARIAPRWSEQTNAAGLTVHTIDPTTGLFAGHTYEYRLTVDGTVTDEGTFETPAGDPIPQGGMEEAGMSCFTQQNADAAFWASGNNTLRGHRGLERPPQGDLGHRGAHRHLGPRAEPHDGRGRRDRLRLAEHRRIVGGRPDDRHRHSALLLRRRDQAVGTLLDRTVVRHERLRRLHGRMQEQRALRR